MPLPIQGQKNSKTLSYPKGILIKANVPIFLNHFYLVVDTKTYRAINRNSFLRHRFISNEIRTTRRSDRTYTGCYFYGEHTYCEFLDTAKLSGSRVGDSGIAFGTEKLGTIANYADAHPIVLKTAKDPVTRRYLGQQVPWFYQATSISFPLDSSMSSWVMEYHPDFLIKWYPNSEVSSIDRKSILRRYKMLIPTVPSPLAQDIKEIVIAMGAKEIREFCRLSESLGLKHQLRSDQKRVIHCQDCSIILIRKSGKYRGIVSVRFVLKKTMGRPHILKIGNSELRLKSDEAEWIFNI